MIKCGICFEDFNAFKIWSLSSCHSFCVTCWKKFISTITKKNALESLTLKCHMFKRGAVFTRDLIEVLVSKVELKRYDDYFVRCYVGVWEKKY